MKKGITYRMAGVNVERAERLLKKVKSLSKTTMRKELLSKIGGFSAFMRVDRNYSNPVVVLSMDGVGTKLLLAKKRGDFFNTGIDLVAMNVNDILTSGAEPVCFMDYIGMGKLEKKSYERAIGGIVEGCKMAGCALAGGETAEMPGMYRKGEMEMVGTAVGIVEKNRIIDGRNIKKGDLLIGLKSSGIHSNGFSLIRKIFKDIDLKTYFDELSGTLIDCLLTPTRIYVKPVLKVLRNGFKLKAMAHITGGGIPGNLSRIIPDGLCAAVEKRAWNVPFIFELIKQRGKIEEGEMFRTFNMGIGFIIVVERGEETGVLKLLEKSGEKGIIIGEIIKYNKKKVNIG